jgi:AbiV family abortive infection protein
LTVAAAEAGISALEDNAARLAHDAELMMHARRYAAAASLAASALLEVARIPILLELALAKSERQIRHFWAKFYSDASEFPWSLFQADGSRMQDTELNRMISFIASAGNRVECLEGGGWTTPGRLVTRGLAQELVGLAKSFTVQKLDIDTVRLWSEVVAAFPKNAHDSQIFDRFKQRLQAKGYGAHAGMVEQFVSRATGNRSPEATPIRPAT